MVQTENDLGRFGNVLIPLFAAGVFLFASTLPVSAAETSVKIIDEEGDVLQNLSPLAKAAVGGGSIAVGDLGGDGISEIVVGSGENTDPKVSVFRQDGSLVRSFEPYGKAIDRGVNVAVGDLDGDGTDEIVTAPAGDGAPHVRTFDGSGNPKFSPGFYAYADSFEGGVNIAVGDLDGNSINEIITTPASSGGPQVRGFDRYGNLLLSFWSFEKSYNGGVSITVGNTDGIAGDEMIAARSSDSKPEIRVFNGRGNSLSAFYAFALSFNGGVNVSTADISGNNVDEIVASPASGGGAQIRIFSMDGTLRSQTTIASKFRGGIDASGIDFSDDESGEEILTALDPDPALGGLKKIEIDISDQKLRYFEGNTLVNERSVSTGKWSMPTPIGTFKVQGHTRTAYSRAYGLYMDWWMAITPDGKYGIHSLPYWKTKNGIIYEGRSHIGIRVSHGCVRLLPEQAHELYAWAPNGTPIMIHQ